MKNYLKKLREENNYTQEDIAQEIKVSRPTYAQMEKGLKDLEVEQARTLASFYDLKMCDFLAKKMPKNLSVEIKELKNKKIPESDIRISVPQESVDKFKEVLLYILEKVGSRPNVGQTVIYKLLYFIDFDYYEKYEEQLMGAKYIKNHFGPTPVAFKKITDLMIVDAELEEVKSKFFAKEQKKYLPRRSANVKILNAQELQHIDEVLERLANKTAKELSEYSHQDIPWQLPEIGEEIEYESVFYRDEDHSVKNCKDEL